MDTLDFSLRSCCADYGLWTSSSIITWLEMPHPRLNYSTTFPEDSMIGVHITVGEALV